MMLVQTQDGSYLNLEKVVLYRIRQNDSDNWVVEAVVDTCSGKDYYALWEDHDKSALTDYLWNFAGPYVVQ